MKLPLIVSILAVAAVNASWAVSRKQSGGIADLTSIATVKGTCKSLLIAGKDRSADCTGKMLRFGYRNGNSGFNYVTGESTILGFAVRDADQINPDDNTSVVPVFRVVLGSSSGNNDIKAVGFCRYNNPFKGNPASIECEAYTAIGVFGGQFLTDGSEPDTKTF